MLSSAYGFDDDNVVIVFQRGLLPVGARYHAVVNGYCHSSFGQRQLFSQIKKRFSLYIGFLVVDSNFHNSHRIGC